MTIQSKKKVRTAIFPVGGLGTRFLPATKSMPKEMLPIANKPIIQYAYEEAKNAGIEKFIFVTGRNKDPINNHFDHAYELEDRLNDKNKSQEIERVSGWMPKAGNICFVRQQKPLGLGHAVWCAREFVADDEPFVVILADEMLMQSKDRTRNFLGEMIDLHDNAENKSSVIAVGEVQQEDVSKYGIVASDNEQKISDMVEKPQPENAPSNLAITGRYILQPEIFQYLEKFQVGSGGEIQLTDAMKEMCKEYPFYYKKIDEKRFDCGNVLGYLEANIAFALADEKIADGAKEVLKKYL